MSGKRRRAGASRPRQQKVVPGAAPVAKKAGDSTSATPLAHPRKRTAKAIPLEAAATAIAIAEGVHEAIPVPAMVAPEEPLTPKPLPEPAPKTLPPSSTTVPAQRRFSSLQTYALVLLLTAIIVAAILLNTGPVNWLGGPKPSPIPSPLYAGVPASGLLPASGAAQQVGRQDTVADSYLIQAGDHATYTQDPPSSGPHYNSASAAQWGYSTDALQPEVYLDNLARGGVVILYDCSNAASCAKEQAAIQPFVSQSPKEAQWQEVKLLAGSYSLGSGKVVLLAWGWRLQMNSWDPYVAARFYMAHVDNGPIAQP